MEWADLKSPPINLLTLHAWSSIMPEKYEVKFYEGKYSARQKAANKDGAVLYVEQHFNASEKPTPNYAMAVVSSNASAKSKAFATDYVLLVSSKLLIGTYWELIRVGGAGQANLVSTEMPAVLLEPCFLTNSVGLDTASSEYGQTLLATCLVEMLHKHFPRGGLIAFSVGHEGNRPGDMGVLTARGSEAVFARKVLNKAKDLLLGKEKPAQEPVIGGKIVIPIIRQGREIAHFPIFAGEQVEFKDNKVIISKAE